MKNKFRIIGGEWRSRCVRFTDAPGLRPTPDRVRETLFNWLQNDVRGSRCLDLYAGSGALGIEAASRGARLVVQVENSPQACRSLKDNAVALAAEQIKIVQTDVLLFLSGDAEEAFDLVFLDPPFARHLAVPTCRRLEQKGWVNRHGKIYVESESHADLTGMPENWQLLKSKTAGDVAYRLFQRAD